MGRGSSRTSSVSGASASSTTGTVPRQNTNSDSNQPNSIPSGLTGRKSVYAQVMTTSDDKALSIIRKVAEDSGAGFLMAEIPRVRQAMRAEGIRSRKAQDMLMERLSRSNRGDFSGVVEGIGMSKSTRRGLYYSRSTIDMSSREVTPMRSFNIYDD